MNFSESEKYLRRFKQGESRTAITARRLNQGIDQTDALAKYVSRNFPQPDQYIPGATEIFLGKIVAPVDDTQADYTDERYWVQKQVPKNSLQQNAVLDVTENKMPRPWGGTVTATNIPELATHSHGLQLDAVVVCMGTVVFHDSAMVRVYWIVGGGSTGAFPVIVAQDGGSNGDDSTEASYTYTVTDLSGNPLGTAVPLNRPRPIGAVVLNPNGPAFGIAFFYQGTLILWDAGEVEDVQICTAP